MAERIRAHDWAATPLGPVEGWPQCLKTVVDLMLCGLQPVYIAFGPALTSLYNDGYIPILGTKHPKALGQPYSEAWPEIWAQSLPLIEAIRAGKAQHFIDRPVALAGRAGLPMSWFTFSWTPLRDETGTVAGFYCSATETTGQVLAQAALQESEERLRFALKAAGAGTWEVVPSTGEFTASDRALELHGLPPGTIMNHDKALAAVHRDDQPRVEEALRRTLTLGEPFRLELRVPLPDGSVRWLELQAELLPDARRPRLIGLVQDISERKHAEEALRRSELRYRELVEQMLDGIFVANPEGRYIDISPAGCAMLGMTREEVLGTHITDVTAPEDHDRIAPEVARFDDGGVHRSEWRFRRKDGSAFIGEVIGRKLQNGNLQAVLRDITDRKSAQEQLAQSRQRILGIIESARDAIISIDTGQRIVLFNAAAEQIFQRSSADMLGQPLDLLIPERFRVIHGEHIGEFARTGVSSRVMGGLAALSALRGDGSEFPIEASISQAKVEGQTLFTVILRDITERKRHEERRETLVGELNHRVKNTLAVVLALANQTLATVSDVDAFEQAFIARIEALARAHDLLTRADWVSTSLAEVVHHALSPYGMERFEIGGPSVVLVPRAAITLTLAFNELATNAAKYGALSEPGGQVAVKWRKQAQGIELLWQECGGPAVVPPTRLGFGSRLIEQVIAYEIDGESELKFSPEGATCRMRFPQNSKGLVGAGSP